MRIITTIPFVLGSVIASASADDVVLRPSVRAPDDGAVRLRHVAELRGEEAVRLGEVLIAMVQNGADVRRVGVDEVRRRLDDAGANWSRLDLAGSAVLVRPRLAAGDAGPAACMPVSMDAGGKTPDAAAGSAGKARPAHAPASPGPRTDPKQRDAGVPADELLAQGGAAALMAQAIQRALGVPAPEVRISLAGLERAAGDADLDGCRVEVDPVGAPDGDRCDFNVRWWRDGRVVRRGTATARTEVAVPVVAAARDLRRGDRPGVQDLATTTRWMRPSERAASVTAKAVQGQALAVNVKSGTPLLREQVERELLVRKNDRIVVRTLVGSLAVSIDAVAQEDGREGEQIECIRAATKGRRDKTTFTATVTAKGEAVVDGAE